MSVRKEGLRTMVCVDGAVGTLSGLRRVYIGGETIGGM